MRKKKVVLLVASCAALLLPVFFGYPAVKLEVISRHDEWYGSYVILPRTAGAADEHPSSPKPGLRLTTARASN